MYDIRLEKAKLAALHESLRRLAKERDRLNIHNPAAALLMCKEEDTRIQISDLQFLIRRQEAELCPTCNGSRSVEVPRGNHAATPELVSCPDCPPGNRGCLCDGDGST